MTPLQRVAMGLVIVALDTLGTYDLVPDWIGWVLVLWGVSALDLRERGTLLTAAVVAGGTALAVWFPTVHEPLREAGPALRWAASLPDLLFVFLLARALSSAARPAEPSDRRFAGRFAMIAWAAVVVALAPPVAEAAGSADGLVAAEVGFVVLWLWLAWNLFAAHRTPWLPVRPGTQDDPRPGGRGSSPGG